jgi:hypothetical protein
MNLLKVEEENDKYNIINKKKRIYFLLENGT